MSFPQNHRQLGSMEQLREFLLVFLSFAAVLTVTAIAHYYGIYRTERVTNETRELLNVGLARSALNSDLVAVVSDLMFLTDYLETQGFDSSGRLRIERITRLFLNFSGGKRLYDQIRLLDPEGGEVVRINFRNGEAQLVEDQALQDKADRYYFREALTLTPDEVYISPLDLNVEQGAVEKPLHNLCVSNS